MISSIRRILFGMPSVHLMINSYKTIAKIPSKEKFKENPKEIFNEFPRDNNISLFGDSTYNLITNPKGQ